MLSCSRRHCPQNSVWTVSGWSLLAQLFGCSHGEFYDAFGYSLYPPRALVVIGAMMDLSLYILKSSGYWLHHTLMMETD